MLHFGFRALGQLAESNFQPFDQKSEAIPSRHQCPSTCIRDKVFLHLLDANSCVKFFMRPNEWVRLWWKAFKVRWVLLAKQNFTQFSALIRSLKHLPLLRIVVFPMSGFAIPHWSSRKFLKVYILLGYISLRQETLTPLKKPTAEIHTIADYVFGLFEVFPNSNFWS